MKNSKINANSKNTKLLMHELNVHQIELEMQNEELRQAQSELALMKEKYFDLYDLAPIGYCILSIKGLIIEANLAATTLFGTDRLSLINQPITNFILNDDQDIFYMYNKQLLDSNKAKSCELRMIRKNNEIFWAHLTSTTIIANDGTSQLRFVLNDVTIVKDYEKKLEHIANYDLLTSLPNRMLLSDRIRQGMAQSLRRKLNLAVIYLDIDKFKDINDTYGHDVGDKLLISLTQNMNKTMREGDTLARLGGDEFVAVLLDLGTIEDCIPMIHRLLEAASTPIVIDDLILHVTASLGVTFFPQLQDVDADQLLRQADQAMYEAKLAGKNRYQVFDTKQNGYIQEHYQIVQSIQNGILNNEFVLHYQPKVNMKTSEVIGLEALIRWQHPQKGIIYPDGFLHEIENTELSIMLGEWVIKTALNQIQIWNNEGLDVVVSINISARQLQEQNFVEKLDSILKSYPSIKSSSLELEILETSQLNDLVFISQTIEACSKIGINFAIDDFGTGYSSLTYLKNLPISLIKIDKSFVNDLLKNKDDQAILIGIIGLAKAFNRNVIAEGVETMAQGNELLKLGCDLAQGYAIAKPMPADQFPKWLKVWNQKPMWKNI